MEYIEYNYKFKVRFRDTDSYGIVHHSNYFCYFEEARYAFSVECLGFTDELIDGSKNKFPVLEASCKYRNAIKYSAKEYNIHLKFRIINSNKIEFLYTITDEKNIRYAMGRTVHAMVNENNKLCLDVLSWFKDRVKGLDVYYE